MRRMVVLTTACATFLLLAWPAAAASSAQLHAFRHARAIDPAARAAHLIYRAPLLYVPLARTLSGTGTISLNVYTLNGAPEVNAEADWWVYQGEDYGTGSGTTDAGGHVDLSGVPAATAYNGEIVVTPDAAANSDNPLYDLWGLDWDASGWGPAGLQPGALPLTITSSDDPHWKVWDSARVRLYSQPDAYVYHMARSDVARTGDVTDGSARTITTGSETLNAGTVYFWDDQGMELAVSGIAVSPGITASPTLDVQQADAQGIWTSGWGSGKPGTKTTLSLEHFPAGWVNDFSGIADWPDTAQYKSLGSKTSAGADTETKSITIPSGAAPGYSYLIWADHSPASPTTLSLVTSFQTCTLMASKTSVRKGAAITVSGIIPTKGHQGPTAGISKTVILYAHRGSAKVPTKWNPKSQGWQKVASIKADGRGRYKSRSFKALKTLTLVVRYPGDAWYRGAYTSAQKITVK